MLCGQAISIHQDVYDQKKHQLYLNFSCLHCIPIDKQNIISPACRNLVSVINYTF